MKCSLKYFLIISAGCCSFFSNAQDAKVRLTDVNATAETKALYDHLNQLSQDHILFGHQHSTQYGHGWSGDANRSDVKSVTGSHPAVIGVDFSGFTGRSDNDIEKEENDVRENIEATYNRGGVTTVCWHFINPLSPGGFYWNDTVSVASVKHIIPGGDKHELYKTILQRIGLFAKSVKGKDGRTVPMIFRPYHEFDGDWFWWGKSHCTADELKSLWRFTISYLRDSMNVHNFIYAFSPDCKFTNENEYLERYPGNDWVDIVGMDDYADFGRDGIYNVDAGVQKLKIVSNYADKNGKIAAFTETGLESIPNPDWWTKILLPAVKTEGLHLAYVLVWRNDKTSPTHFYAPFPGQVSAPDFKKFYNDKFTMFEKDLPVMYK